VSPTGIDAFGLSNADVKGQGEQRDLDLEGNGGAGKEGGAFVGPLGVDDESLTYGEIELLPFLHLLLRLGLGVRGEG
jgi:hypothetical protein